MRERGGTPGLFCGVLGCVFGVLGILSLGLVFTPIAALFSLFGLLGAVGGFSPTGMLVSLVGCFLTVAGFIVSPTLWIVAIGFLGALAPKNEPPHPLRPAQEQPVGRPFVHECDPLALASPECESKEWMPVLRAVSALSSLTIPTAAATLAWHGPLLERVARLLGAMHAPPTAIGNIDIRLLIRPLVDSQFQILTSTKC